MTLIAIVFAGFAAFAGQAPPQSAAQQNAPASMDGVVIRFGSNDGIAQATVELRRIQTQPSAPPVRGQPAPIDPLQVQGAPEEVIRQLAASGRLTLPPPPLTFTTDSTGRFQFLNVAPGEYRLYVTRETGFTCATRV